MTLRVSKRWLKRILWGALFMNVFIGVPAVLLLLCSSSLRYTLYQSVLAPRLGQPKIVFLGDSLVKGGALWGLRLNEYSFDVWNYGRDGYCIRQLRSCAESLTSRGGVDHVFIMAGINELDKTQRGAKLAFEEYTQLIETFTAEDIEPVVCLTLYTESEKDTAFVTQLNKYLRCYAEEHELLIIDLNGTLAPKGVLLPHFSKDGLHITEQAYELWAKEVLIVMN